jgi:predicted permease
MASLVPFGEFQEGNLVQKAGTPPAPEGQRETGVSATYTIVAADYFETMRMPIIRGRGFTPAEEAAPGGPAIAVVDEPLARQLFGGGDAIGERVQFARGRSQAPKEYTIVGIVAGIRHDMFDKVPVAHLYVPFGQNARSRMNLHVRISNPGPAAEAAMLGTLRQEIRAADAQVPVTDLETLTQHRDGSVMLWAVNTGARLFAIFGAVALLLAVVGVYGVKAYVVSRRTREIGIRMALGATPGNVMWLVLREGMTLTAFGLGAGLVLAGLTGRLLSGMLYEVSPIDPLVFAGAPLVLAAAALTASYLPARKATKVLPLTALRTD